MGSDNWLGAEPPKDANGEVIPLDTDVLYSESGEVLYVSGFQYSPHTNTWGLRGGYEGVSKMWCGETNRYFLAPPDTWDKLIDDLRNSAEKDIAACAYFNPDGKDCAECQSAGAENCTSSAFTDIADRIEKLRESDDD